jgi:hypothetical protein
MLLSPISDKKAREEGRGRKGRKGEGRGGEKGGGEGRGERGRGGEGRWGDTSGITTPRSPKCREDEPELSSLGKMIEKNYQELRKSKT